LVQMSLQGTSNQYLWGNLVWWNNRSVPALIGLCFFFLSRFSKSFLETKSLSPFANRLLNLAGCLSIGLFACAIFFYDQWVNQIITHFQLIFFALLIVASMSSWRHGARYA